MTETARVAAVPGAGNALSATETERFGSDGFLVVRHACDGAELRLIRATLLGLFAARAGRAEGNHFDMLSLDHAGAHSIQPQLVKPSLYAPALLRTRHFRRMQDIARQLLGPETQFSFDHSILKPAASAAATPWHQDEAHDHDPYFRHEQISFWMPLQDVSEENGCMRYVPGSHRGPLLPHRSPDNDPRIHAIECAPGTFDEAAAVTRPVPAGSCILHGGRTLHAALPNRSAADRLVYVLAFRGPPVPRAEPTTFDWLAAKRTARDERSLRWRSQGGIWVLVARRLEHALRSDLRTLPGRLGKLARLARARMLRAWKRR